MPCGDLVDTLRQFFLKVSTEARTHEGGLALILLGMWDDEPALRCRNLTGPGVPQCRAAVVPVPLGPSPGCRDIREAAGSIPGDQRIVLRAALQFM